MPDRQKRNQQIERFRAWCLTALYFALALWGIVFCFATYYFWTFLTERAGDNVWSPVTLMLLSLTTFVVSARAGHVFLGRVRAQEPLPRVDFLPFVSISATILIAGRAFGAG